MPGQQLSTACTVDSPERLDLLLGTQGWRTFIYRDPLAGMGVSATHDPPARPQGTGTSEKSVPRRSTVIDRDRLERMLGIHEVPRRRYRMQPWQERPLADKFVFRREEPEAVFLDPERDLMLANADKKALLDGRGHVLHPARAGLEIGESARMRANAVAGQDHPRDAPFVDHVLDDDSKLTKIADASRPWQVVAQQSPEAVAADTFRHASQHEQNTIVEEGVAFDQALNHASSAEHMLRKHKVLSKPAQDQAWRAAPPMGPRLQADAMPAPPSTVPAPAPDMHMHMHVHMNGDRREVEYKRLYAHQVYKSGGTDDGGASAARSDFTETVFWAAGLHTDANGRATSVFTLSHAVTTYRVVAEAHQHGSLDMDTALSALGANDSYTMQVGLGVQVDAKLPLCVMRGDNASVLLKVTNHGVNTVRVDSVTVMVAGAEGVVSFEASALSVDAHATPESTRPMKQQVISLLAAPYKLLASQCRMHTLYMLVTGDTTDPSATKAAGSVDYDEGGQGTREVRTPMMATLTATVHGKLMDGDHTSSFSVSDGISRAVALVPRGFPVAHHHGGMLSADSPQRWTVQVPDDAVGVTAVVQVMTSPVASLHAAIRALIREPCGCFEQTSATTYPIVMALQYLHAHAHASEHDAERNMLSEAEAMLGRGFERLRAFEVRASGGFEWFGAEPAHEALTAYALMQFVDMAQVRPACPPCSVFQCRIYVVCAIPA
jgi:hypothetical protein